LETPSGTAFAAVLYSEVTLDQSFADRVVDVGLMLIEARVGIEVRNELHKPVLSTLSGG
jgi:hypothetical protein